MDDHNIYNNWKIVYQYIYGSDTVESRAKEGVYETNREGIYRWITFDSSLYTHSCYLTIGEDSYPPDRHVDLVSWNDITLRIYLWDYDPKWKTYPHKIIDSRVLDDNQPYTEAIRQANLEEHKYSDSAIIVTEPDYSIVPDHTGTQMYFTGASLGAIYDVVENLGKLRNLEVWGPATYLSSFPIVSLEYLVVGRITQEVLDVIKLWGVKDLHLASEKVDMLPRPGVKPVLRSLIVPRLGNLASFLDLSKLEKLGLGGTGLRKDLTVSSLYTTVKDLEVKTVPNSKVVKKFTNLERLSIVVSFELRLGAGAGNKNAIKKKKQETANVRRIINESKLKSLHIENFEMMERLKPTGIDTFSYNEMPVDSVTYNRLNFNIPKRTRSLFSEFDTVVLNGLETSLFVPTSIHMEEAIPRLPGRVVFDCEKLLTEREYHDSNTPRLVSDLLPRSKAKNARKVVR
uniref:Uncharacterized protein n=1 Tax=viral metagenome TaxID=1070528 RepID=A0A6C0JUR0_9ZZZZ